MAGDRAAASWANREAVNHYREAWGLIDAAGDDPKSTEKRLDTAIKLAEVMEPLGEFDPTLVLLEEVLRGSSDEEDPARYARVHYWMGNNFGNMGRYDEARTHLLRALELSQRSGSKETEGNTHNYLGQLDWVQGYLRRALDHMEASVRCQREIGNPARIAWGLVMKGAVISALKGEDDRANALEEAKEWVERSGNDRARCILHLFRCMNLLDAGQYERALKKALAGLDLAEKIGEGIQTVYHLAMGGRAALYTGNHDFALSLLQRGEAEGQRVGHPLGRTWVRLVQAETLLRLGRLEEALEPAEAALRFCQDLDLGARLQTALEIYAEILANRSPMDDPRIDAMMAQAAALVQRSGSPWERIKHLMAHARISLKRGRLDRARENLSVARSLHQEMGVEGGTGELRSIEEALAKEEAKGGGDVRGE
jgi:tetratricopeptide (TPR) repeat protein